MKTGKVVLEIITIYCPECDNALVNPDSGVTDIQEGEYDGLSSVLKCQDCGTYFKKPKVTFERG